MAGLGYVPESGRRPGAPPFFSELNHAPAFPGSRYVAVENDSVESRLTLGLGAERAGETDEALRRFEEAAARAPTFHVPRLLAGTLDPDPARGLEHLRRSAELAPRSCRTAYEIGARLHAVGDDAGARVAWERCRILAPAFGAAEARLAELADAAGHLEEACRRFEDAALQNSFLAWPIARLAAIAIDGGQLEKAVALLRPSLKQDEELCLTNLLLGRAYLEMGRHQEARLHLDRALDAPGASGEDRAATLALLATVELRMGAPAASRARLAELRRQEAHPRDPHAGAPTTVEGTPLKPDRE
jgi:tetratricopeptide (TPR) repeat protein